MQLKGIASSINVINIISIISIINIMSIISAIIIIISYIKLLSIGGLLGPYIRPSTPASPCPYDLRRPLPTFGLLSWPGKRRGSGLAGSSNKNGTRGGLGF